MKLTTSNRRVEEVKSALFFGGLLTLATIIIWIGVSIYSAFSKTSIDPEIQSLITPLNPVLDSEVLKHYAETRVSPPDTFTVIATIREANQKVTKIIDPFNDLGL